MCECVRASCLMVTYTNTTFHYNSDHPSHRLAVVRCDAVRLVHFREIITLTNYLVYVYFFK